MQSTTAREIEKILRECMVECACCSNREDIIEEATDKIVNKATAKEKIHWSSKKGPVFLISKDGKVFAFAYGDTAVKSFVRYDLSSVLSFDREFSVAVPMYGWATVVRFFKAGVLPTVAEENDELVLRCGTERVQYVDDVPEEIEKWPDVTPIDCGIHFEKSVLAVMAEAADPDGCKPSFNSICLSQMKGKWCLAASDSRRLDVSYEGFSTREASGDPIFIPLQVTKSSGIISAKRHGKGAIFLYDNVQIIYEPDVQFPDFSFLLHKWSHAEKGCGSVVFFPDGMEALRRAVKLGRGPSYKTIITKDGSVNTGGTIEKTRTKFEDDATDFGVNADYLLHAAKFTNAKPDGLIVHFCGPRAPLEIEDWGTGKRFSIVMPIAIPDKHDDDPAEESEDEQA